jgi:hypothetical protein
MRRREEAHISQSSISRDKTIYVEGNLDVKIIRDFLEHSKITNVRVTEVSNEEFEGPFGAKKKVIEIIKKANHESISSEYMGIVDLDYDYFTNSILNIPNLQYTDYNSIESYFLKLDLINKLLEDYNISPVESNKFEKWVSNTLLMSSWFYFQTSHIDKLSNDEKISFIKLRLDNNHFVDFKIDKIKLGEIVKHKTDCLDKDKLKQKYFTFIKGLNRQNIYENKPLFLHGKHTFKFVVCLLHNKHKKLKSLSYENLECILKDKFILFFARTEVLFSKIINFAGNNITTASSMYSA